MKSFYACMNRQHKQIPLRLRLTFFFVVFSVLQISAMGYGQKVSLSFNNAPLDEVLSSIKRQTGINFLYTSSMLNKASKVTVKLKDSPLSAALEETFRSQAYLTYTITENMVVIKEVKAPTPERRDLAVTGKVTDEKGEGLQGVTVALKGTGVQTLTNADGLYSLRLPRNSGSLRFTFIGYEPFEIPVTNNPVVNVSMKLQNNSLNDVVVVGYGQQKKLTVVGAVASISTRDLKQSPTANVTNALAGRLPGLITTQFGGGEPGLDGSELFIRGVGTYNSNGRGPVVIVDGLERPFNYLNPEEIESISILKDASATAIFGIRGAAGVVVVTTKRGSVKDKPDVNFKVTSGISDAVKYPKYLGSYGYALLYNEAMKNDNPLVSPSSLFSEDQIENWRTAKGDNSDGKGYSNDYYDVAFKPTHQTDYTLSINGGSNTARYFVLASYLSQDNNYRHVDLEDFKVKDGFRKYNFRTNVDVNINPNFSARLDLSARVQNRVTPGSSGSNPAETIVMLANTLPPIYPIVVPANDNPANADFLREHDGQLLFGNAVYRNNILGELSKTGYINEYYTYLEGTFRLAHKLDFITKGLRAEAFVAYDSYAGNRIYRDVPPITEGSRSFPGYATFSPSVGLNEYWNANPAYQGAYVSTRSGIDANIVNTLEHLTPNRRTTGQFTLNYDRSFGLHNVTGLFLTQRALQTRGNEVPFARQGFSSRVTYNYKQKYLAELNMAYNGSENFATGLRYGFFPAVALGWAISEEKFIKDIGAISYLKLRGSFGLAGSDDLGSARFRYVQLYNASSTGGYQFGNDFAGGNPGGMNEGELSNPIITWEKSEEANIGLDLELFNSRLGLTADVFRKYRYDILTTAYTGAANGYTEILGQFPPPLNIGRVLNKGIDLELRYRDRIGQVSFYLKPNFTFTRNKILFRNEVSRQYDWMKETGKPIGTNFVYLVDGFFQSQAEIDDLTKRPEQQWGRLVPGDVRYRDIDGNGVIQADFDQVPIGHPRIPEIQFGVPVGLSYKDFDLSMVFQGAARTSLLLNGPAVYPFPSFDFDKLGNVKPMHLGRWTPDNPNAKFPALHIGNHPNNQQESTLYLYDASYLRLKTIEFGYRLPKKVLNRAKLKSVRFFLQGLNIATWDKLSDIDVDPETKSGNGAWYPIQKIYNAGVEITL